MKSAAWILAAVGGWLVFSRVWPKRVCRWCRGQGETAPNSTSTARRDCWRCGGSKRTRAWFAPVPRIVTLGVVVVAAVLFLA